jgi:deoxyribodipyrimidine photolyase-related protein
MILLLPNQLFPKEKIPENELTLIEHPKFFTDKDFHKQKLILHKASMTAYQERNDTEYIGLEEDYEKVFRENNEVITFDPVDHEILEEFKGLAEENNVDLKVQESSNFLASRKFNRDYFKDNRIFQLDYYKKMRKKHDILMTDDGPEGGKWSFDQENRKKMPQDMETPEIPKFSSEYVEDAKAWVEENFSDNPGKVENFFWPTTRDQALEMLDDFLENRMEKFGDYQDAFEKDLEFGFHALTSSSINTGLLNPEEVVERTLAAHEEKDYPMNSLEGFLRQIVGWREFIRAMYQIHPEMRDENFWDIDNEMPEEFYTGETGLPPVDYAIQHADENAYCHHIERLMVLSNSMLLLEIHPEEVYDWFMEMFIDSYEWVMVPNVYGMGQYAWPDMMTKPYISSSNYINKMSHYTGGEWENHWDGLYWNFINKHEDKISDIHRMSFMTSTLNRMNEDTVEKHVENAKEFKDKLSTL